MKKWCWNLLKVCISCGVLFYIFRSIPFSGVVAAIRSANVGYIGIAYLIGFGITYINACQMKVLTDKQGMRLSTRQIVEINLITRLYLLFLPGDLAGGAIRWYKLGQPNKKWVQALACMGYSRFINTLVLIILGVSFWTLDGEGKSHYSIVLGMILFLCIVLLLYCGLFNETGGTLVRNSLDRINVSFIPKMGQSTMKKLINSTTQFDSLSKGVVGYILGLSIGRQLMGVLSFYLLALSIGMDISFIVIGWVGSVIQIITMLPISFSGLGVREGSLIVLLQSYGVSATDALAVSFLLFGRRILFGAVGGLLEVKELVWVTAGRSGEKRIA